MTASLICLLDQVMVAFSERLRTLREACKMTQLRLAALLKIDLRVYSRWERTAATSQFDTVVLDSQIKRSQMFKVLAA